ncbi:hypothetical protein [Sinomonas sp. B1-1]
MTISRPQPVGAKCRKSPRLPRRAPNRTTAARSFAGKVRAAVVLG